MESKTVYRGVIFCFKDTAPMANLPSLTQDKSTDWGAGNCLSMFAVMDDAYKVSMLNNAKCLA